jgi:DNA-binding beta-propeller fold protein YncE
MSCEAVRAWWVHVTTEATTDVTAPAVEAPVVEDAVAAAADDRGRRRRRLVAGLVVLLLVVFALIVGWYLLHRDPLRVPGLGKQAVPHYAFSIYGTTRPMGVAVSADGQKVFVAGSDGARQVVVYDRAGHQTGTLKPPDSAGASHLPVYVATDPATGEVFVSDRATAAVYVYGPQGGFRRTFVPTGLPAAGHGEPVWQPLGIGFDPAGHVYVTEVGTTHHRVLVLAKDGRLLRTIGASDGLLFPNGVTVGPDGHVFVTDSNNGRLMVFDRTGAKVAAIDRGVGEGDLGLPRGLAFGPGNTLYVVDTASHTVKVYDHGDATGKPAPGYRGTFGAEGNEDGAFEYPNGITTDNHNRVYITDRENNRVQVWTY